MKRLNQKGFAGVIEIVLIAAVITAIAFVGWRAWSASKHSGNNSSSSSNTGENDQNTPPLKLKSIGFNLDYYNPANSMAGDMRFARVNFFNDQIWADFGGQDPRTPDPTKKNPQPVFYLPVETPVRSL